ncbi:MAG: BRCT domain-containing protein [Planctomycetota bacterium]
MLSTRSGNANALMLMIVLMVFTAAFGFLAWNRYDTTQIILHGRDGSALKIRDDNGIQDVKRAIQSLEDEVAQMEQREQVLQRRVNDLGMLLTATANYWDDGRWMGDEDGTYTSTWVTVRNLVQADHDMLRIWDEGYKDAERHEFDALNDMIERSRDAIERIGNQIADEEDTFNNTRDRLIAEQDNLNEKREELRKQGRLRYAELSIEKSKLEARIRDLLELKLQWVEELASDGQVLATANAGQHVVINLGARDGVHTGMRFEIFSLVHGHHVPKGLCEVVELSDRVATCRVLETYDDRLHPLAEGDQIANPVFDKDRPQAFVLAGEFDSFNAEDLAAFIERAGGIVRDKLDPSVDFLVAGMRSDAEQDAAREYRVLALREEQLVKFLDTTFRPDDQR